MPIFRGRGGRVVVVRKRRSGTALTDWTPLAAVEEADGAPNDVLGLGASGTGFADGQFRHVWANHTNSTNADGSQESPLWWSRKLTTADGLYPNLDPDIHRLELRLRFDSPYQFPLAGTADTIGVFGGVSDGALGGSASAALMAMLQTGASQFQSRRVNGSSTVSYGSLTSGGNDRGIIGIEWVNATGAALYPIVTASWRNTGSDPATYAISTGSPAFASMSDDIDTWLLVTGSVHNSIVDPVGRDIRWALEHRLCLRASGI